jgi:CubicO group peptidase (beta-lactamase class C family)
MHRVALFSIAFFWILPTVCLAQTSHDINPAINSSNPMNSILDKKIDVEVRQAMKRRKMIGMAVEILKNGKTTFYGYGETSRGNNLLPDERTIFDIGSITKTFTATLLAYAANEGKLNLNDPVNKYLPDSIPPLEYKGTPVTLLTMSNHTSGLPSWPSNLNSSDISNSINDYSNSDLLSFLAHFKLQRNPGVKLEYSNLAVATLGFILQDIYKMTYDSLVAKVIDDPLGLHDTRLIVPTGDSARVAKGYGSDGKAVSAWSLKAFAGAGGLRSTAADLLKYAAANMGEAPPALNKAILLTHTTTYSQKGDEMGLGWEIDRSNHHKWFEHDGETNGFQSFLVLDAETHIAVVVLSNKATNDDDVLDDLGEGILKLVEKN